MGRPALDVRLGVGVFGAATADSTPYRLEAADDVLDALLDGLLDGIRCPGASGTTSGCCSTAAGAERDPFLLD